MNDPLSTPLTDELHGELRGEWDKCYASMHRHAELMEQRYNEAKVRADKLEAQIAKALSGPSIPVAFLAQIKLGDVHRILDSGLSAEEMRRITVD